MRQPPLGRDLAELRANLGADLRLHQLPGDQRDRLPDEILQPTIAHLRNDIGNRHALTIGHRGVSFTSTAVQPTSSAPRWPTLAGPRPTRRSLHHFYRRDRERSPDRERPAVYAQARPPAGRSSTAA